jgi:hypothetical protein
MLFIYRSKSVVRRINATVGHRHRARRLEQGAYVALPQQFAPN